MDDPKVIKVSEAYVRIIIRRPHAYEFVRDRKAPIPGIAILDAEGKVVDTYAFDGDDATGRLARMLTERK